MANTQSALKNIRKNRTNYLRNRAASSRLKTLEKKFLAQVTEKNQEEASTAAKSLISALDKACLLYTSPSPRDRQKSRMPSSA